MKNHHNTTGCQPTSQTISQTTWVYLNWKILVSPWALTCLAHDPESHFGATYLGLHYSGKVQVGHVSGPTCFYGIKNIVGYEFTWLWGGLLLVLDNHGHSYDHTFSKFLLTLQIFIQMVVSYLRCPYQKQMALFYLLFY